MWEFHLTDNIIEWVRENCLYLVATDFQGYLFTPYVGCKVSCGLRNDGMLVFFPNNRKPLSDRGYKHIIKRLMKDNIIRCTSFDPFPEYESYNNIKAPTDESKIKYIPSPLFYGLEEN